MPITYIGTDKRKWSQNAFYCLFYFSSSCIYPVWYIFTVLFYLLLWVRSMEVHLILNLFIHAPIQIMDRQKSNFRSYSSLAVFAGSLLSNADTHLPSLSTLVLKGFFEYIWLACSQVCPGFLLVALTLKMRWKFLPSIEPIAVSFLN